MRGVCIGILILAGLPQAMAAETELTDQQKVGWRIYETSCGVCHTRPTLVSGMYGPELNKNSAGGDAKIMADTITNGTPRMPGFKYTYNPDQIAAVAAYLKTVEPGHQNLPH